MKYLKYLSFCLFTVFSCHTDKDDDVLATLETYISSGSYELGAVIACAASDFETNDILIFYYPEAGATNIRLFETGSVDVDKLDFSKYTRQFIVAEPFFNGHLGKFTQSCSVEKWIVVTFELNGELKISNPIRTKQITKPTVWNDNVDVDQTTSGMPNFIWEDNPVGDNAIYFQVISDDENNLLSGTYTYDNNFQYYNISNVVLNVTTQTPPSLIIGDNYNFTLMDVSLDNWVNWVVQKTFKSE